LPPLLAGRPRQGWLGTVRSPSASSQPGECTRAGRPAGGGPLAGATGSRLLRLDHSESRSPWTGPGRPCRLGPACPDRDGSLRRMLGRRRRQARCSPLVRAVMAHSERQARTPKIMRVPPPYPRRPVRSATHRCAARGPAPPATAASIDTPGPGGADTVDRGRDHRSPRPHPNRPPPPSAPSTPPWPTSLRPGDGQHPNRTATTPLARAATHPSGCPRRLPARSGPLAQVGPTRGERPRPSPGCSRTWPAPHGSHSSWNSGHGHGRRAWRN
jgi:hypothetical protein